MRMLSLPKKMRAGSEESKLFSTAAVSQLPMFALLGDVAQIGAVDLQFGGDPGTASTELLEGLRTPVSVRLREHSLYCLFRRLHRGPACTVDDLYKARCIAAVRERI